MGPSTSAIKEGLGKVRNGYQAGHFGCAFENLSVLMIGRKVDRLLKLVLFPWG
jgi:hypothetical protein